MRGFFLAAVLGVMLIGGVLSFRPGGLRVQLRLVKRRLRVAIILAGIFMVLEFAARVFSPSLWISDLAMVVIGLGIAVAFLIWAQDPPLEVQQPQQSQPRLRR